MLSLGSLMEMIAKLLLSMSASFLSLSELIVFMFQWPMRILFKGLLPPVSTLGVSFVSNFSERG